VAIRALVSQSVSQSVGRSVGRSVTWLCDTRTARYMVRHQRRPKRRSAIQLSLDALWYTKLETHKCPCIDLFPLIQLISWVHTGVLCHPEFWVQAAGRSMSIAFVMWCSFLGKVDPNSCYGKCDRVEETEAIETAVKAMDGVKKTEGKKLSVITPWRRISGVEV